MRRHEVFQKQLVPAGSISAVLFGGVLLWISSGLPYSNPLIVPIWMAALGALVAVVWATAVLVFGLRATPRTRLGLTMGLAAATGALFTLTQGTVGTPPLIFYVAGLAASFSTGLVMAGMATTLDLTRAPHT